METHLRAMACHWPYRITQCYLPPDTSECAMPRLNPSQTGRYLIYLPQRDGRLSWTRQLVTYLDGLPVHKYSIYLPQRDGIIITVIIIIITIILTIHTRLFSFFNNECLLMQYYFKYSTAHFTALAQASHLHMHLSASSKIWYWPNHSHALRLRR